MTILLVEVNVVNEIRYCKGCFERERLINDLKKQVQNLKIRLNIKERKLKEGYFGSSTPSSKIPIKANSLKERQAKKGGGKPGHKGYGRKIPKEEDIDREEFIFLKNDKCPDCECLLVPKVEKSRTVYEYPETVKETVVYHLERKACPQCRKYFQAQPPGVLPKGLFSNQLLSHVANQHYLHGAPMGKIAQQLGINYSSLLEAMHRLGKLLSPIPEGLIEVYRKSPVKHADETGWRTDGENGYAWIFATPNTVLYRFRKSRSARVPAEVFGKKKLPGVLVVDRYNGYNKMPCDIQYCYSHLLRKVKDLEKEFPEDNEIITFVETFGSLLKSAINLRKMPYGAGKYRAEAKKLKGLIKKAVNSPAHHAAIREVQDIFRIQEKRLYHWIKNKSIPTENNYAERELRQLVIARKVSFGSQSEKGARTRESLMSIVHTLSKRTKNPTKALKDILDKIAINPQVSPYKYFRETDTS